MTAPEARGALEPAFPPQTVTLPLAEVEALRRDASRLRVIARTVIGVVGILGLAAVLIVALAIAFD